ncbi:MAG: RDD family protein [Candidatus Koribacter versatilis]|uniref:RDD family protein n=1 Tax=Candidatus Korobacter versatilis TaxID=658062 RepID=A0A932EQP6_9BACT|nr:RDD family protein [Candidatus Koribacter versatilis]
MSVLIDPESYDDSEQQFASTLNAAADDTSLVHDLMMGGDDDMPLGDLSLGSTGTPIVTPQLGVSQTMAPAAVTTTLIEAATTEPPPQFYRPPEPPVWRDEVTSRVDAYHAKRGRGRRYDAAASSLSLNFEPAPEAPPQQRYAAIRLETVEKVPDTNLIEFPRPMPVASVMLAPPPMPLADELAESIREIETPRILDVPDGAHTLPAHPLADIHLDEPSTEPALDQLARRMELALPLPVAPIGPRLGAGLVDLLIVLTATAIFGMIFMMIAKELPQGRDLAACALALPAILWAAYHYAFLVRCGTTPGMQMTQLGLAPFDDEKPITLGRRRARALAMSVSAMSLWLGFVWAFLDEDRLAWHDRISHTFLVNQ